MERLPQRPVEGRGQPSAGQLQRAIAQQTDALIACNRRVDVARAHLDAVVADLHDAVRERGRVARHLAHLTEMASTPIWRRRTRRSASRVPAIRRVAYFGASV